MIVNPWGEVVVELGDESEPQIVTADIDLDLVAKIRREMPLLRRTDIYPVV
jgi:predicted amidohydrolase